MESRLADKLLALVGTVFIAASVVVALLQYAVALPKDSPGVAWAIRICWFVIFLTIVAFIVILIRREPPQGDKTKRSVIESETVLTELSKKVNGPSYRAKTLTELSSLHSVGHRLLMAEAEYEDWRLRVMAFIENHSEAQSLKPYFDRATGPGSTYREQALNELEAFVRELRAKTIAS